MRAIIIIQWYKSNIVRRLGVKNLELSSQNGASDSITDFSMLSNLAGAQLISCFGTLW